MVAAVVGKGGVGKTTVTALLVRRLLENGANTSFVNRIVNRCIQLMFWTRFNDLTNAFKAYRTAVIRDCGPY